MAEQPTVPPVGTLIQVRKRGEECPEAAVVTGPLRQSQDGPYFPVTVWGEARIPRSAEVFVGPVLSASSLNTGDWYTWAPLPVPADVAALVRALAETQAQLDEARRELQRTAEEHRQNLEIMGQAREEIADEFRRTQALLGQPIEVKVLDRNISSAEVVFVDHRGVRVTTSALGPFLQALGKQPASVGDRFRVWCQRIDPEDGA